MAFEDTWEWNMDAEAAFEEIVERGGRVSDAMRAFRTFLGHSDMMAYLAMMAPRLIELHRVLDPLVERFTGNCGNIETRNVPLSQKQSGQIILGDSLDHMATLKSGSVDLIVTSPPFGLLRKKDYGNVESGEYIEWFKPFGQEFKRILKSSGSLVIDLGGAWLPGQPTRCHK
jgi:hypothetical protein